MNVLHNDCKAFHTLDSRYGLIDFEEVPGAALSAARFPS